MYLFLFRHLVYIISNIFVKTKYKILNCYEKVSRNSVEKDFFEYYMHVFFFNFHLISSFPRHTRSTFLSKRIFNLQFLL